MIIFCSCTDDKSNPTTFTGSQEDLGDTTEVQDTTAIELLESKAFIGNDEIGISDSVRLTFNKPITVDYIRVEEPNRFNQGNLPVVYSQDSTRVTFSYKYFSVGSSYYVKYSVRDSLGASLINAVDVDFYYKSKVVDGRIFQAVIDDKTSRYWVGMNELNRIRCYSLPDLELINEFKIPAGASKFVINPYDNNIYIILHNRSIPVQDSSIYVYNSSGQLLRRIYLKEEKAYPRVYPYDIGFTNSGIGIVLLADKSYSGMNWAFIDSRNNNESYTCDIKNFDHYGFDRFAKIYHNFDSKELICVLNNSWGIFNGTDRSMKKITLGHIDRSIFITPNRTDDRIYCGHSSNQFIWSREDGLSNQTDFINDYNGSADFSYRANEDNIIYFLDSDYFRILDYNNSRVLMKRDVRLGLNAATTTLDGRYFITYLLSSNFTKNSQIIVFDLDTLRQSM